MERVGDSPVALVANRMRKASKRKRIGLTKRIRAAIDTLVWGKDEQVVGWEIAAAAGGISVRSLRDAINKPAVLAYYREQMRALREGHRPANIHTAAEIRDDPALKKTAAGQRVRLAAAALLDADLTQGPNAVSVNVGVNVVTPGYVMDLREPDQMPVKPVHKITHLDAHDTNALITLEDVPE